MKLLILLLSGTIGLNAGAAVLTVDNSASAPAMYSTVTAAITAASAGDTIYLQPSGISYGGISLYKKLCIVGSGVFPTKQDNRPVIVDHVFLYTGSDGSQVMGVKTLDASYGVWISSSSIQDITVANCYFVGFGVNISDLSFDIIIEGCVFEGKGLQLGGAGTGNAPSNILVQNSIFNCKTGVKPVNSDNTASGSNVRFKNNIFISDAGNKVFYRSPSVAVSYILQNNIFYNTDPTTDCPNCVYNNNTVYQGSNPPNNTSPNSGNIFSDPMLVNFPTAGGYFDVTHDYHLLNASPCLSAGVGGTDIGLFGGDERYNVGIQAPFPYIFELNLINSNVPETGTLNFQVTAKKKQ